MSKKQTSGKFLCQMEKAQPGDRRGAFHFQKQKAAFNRQHQESYLKYGFIPTGDSLQPFSIVLAVFRSLLFTSAEEEVQRSMVNNFRVQQPLRGRTVRSSFIPFLQEAPVENNEPMP